MKIFIAVPCMDQVPALFAQSLAMLRREADCVVGFQIGSLIYDARNKLATSAIKAGADYVLWLDSDMVFPPDLLGKMLKECKEKNIDFLSGLYFRRNPPYSTVLYDKLEALPDGKGCAHTSFECVPEGTFEVGGCGFGCVLMATDVLMSVSAKYAGHMFEPDYGMGEDLAFCWRARQAGYKIFCDSTLECGHVGHAVITRSYFEAFREGDKNA